MASNPVFDQVLAMGPIDDEWGISEQNDEHIIFKGAFGHAEVKSDGRVISKVAKYVEMLEAAIKGEELPVKPKAAGKTNGQGNTSIAPRKASLGQIAKSGKDLTEDDILSHLCPKATSKEAYMAVQICKNRGMDPWSGDVHFIKYGDSPLTIVAGKEHFTKKAEANPQFDGFQAGIIVKTKDGSYSELEGTFYTDEELVGGWAKVWRKDRKEPFVQKVRLSAFDTKKALWSKMPEVMIRKCALVNSLREAFPGDLGGVYDTSEMGQAVDADFEEVA